MPRVYVGTYAKYAAGNLAGQWIDLEEVSDMETFEEMCREIHKDESDPEFMYQAHEDIPSKFISESRLDPDVWSDWVDLDDNDREIYSAYLKYDSSADFDTARDAYCGEYTSKEDWAETYLNDTGILDKVPAALKGYFDYKAYARDAELGGMVFIEINDDASYGVMVFNPS